ncbi:ankyrin repeat-containing domain protein [Hypoxylon argillaceum]|nr:ankyrin repeat-containing domain protein [Hypoxylon argillaceum]
MSEGDQQVTGNHPSSLSQPDFLNSPECPLLRYAVQYWPFHLKSSLCGLDETAATQLVKSILLEYLGDEKIVESWLRQAFNLRFPRIKINDSILPFASQLSPCRIMQNHGIPLLQAIEVTWDSLSVIHLLDWNIGASLAWALTKITGNVQASAVVWHNNTQHDKEKNLKLLVESMRLCSKTSINLIFNVQKEYIDSNLPDLLLRDLVFGGATLLAYIAEEGRRQHGGLRLRTPEPHHVFSAVSFSSMIGSLLDYGDRGFLGALDNYGSGSSLLHLAVSSGHDVAVERLAGLNIDINARDAKGRTAVFLASECGLSHILEILLRPDRAANISLPNNEGQTPLHAATQGGYIRCVTALLEAGNTLGQPTQKDISALIKIGVKSNYRSLVALLLEYEKHRHSMPGDVRTDGSQLDAVSESNHTTNVKGKQYPYILTISIENRQSAMAKLLAERGADLGFLDHLQRGPLHLAAKRSQHRVVAALLARGVDVNILDSCKKTPLCYAAENGDTVCISLLLEAKASVTFESIFSAAKIAIKNGHDQAAQMLISTRSSNKYSSRTLREWLHCAASSGLTHVATQLLDMGAGKDYRDDEGHSALHWAVLWSQIDIVRLLFIRQASLELMSVYGKTALSYAAEDEKQPVEIIELLLDAGADLETTDQARRTPLAIACQRENNHTVMFLLEQGANIGHSSVSKRMLLKALEKFPKVDGLKVLAAQKTNFVSNVEHVDYLSSLLEQACRGRMTQDMLSVLLQTGADPNHESAYNLLYGGALQQAVYNSCMPIVKGLLEHPDTGLNINGIAGKFGTVLNFSVANQDISAEEQWAMFQYLVQSGADPLICAGCYGTPLHTAVALSTIDIVEHMFSLWPINVCLDTEDHEGRLPAHIVALSRNKDLLPIFLTGVYLDKPDRQGRQPIHLASGIGFLTMLDYLAQQCKAEERELASLLSASDNDGWTPLHWACRQNNEAVVKWLVEKGPEAKSARTIRENWTPYDVAKAHSYLRCRELLGYTEVDDDKACTTPVKNLVYL